MFSVLIAFYKTGVPGKKHGEPLLFALVYTIFAS